MKRILTLIASTLLVVSSFAQAPLTQGEVTKIDKANAKLTIRHGEIKNLDMPPMTMVFRVRDPKMLDSVAVGNRVRFAVERIDGNFTVTAMSPDN